jgi:hypothetical protein
VEPQWNPECQGEEDRFAGHEDYELPSPRAGEWLVTDAAPDELSEIIDKLPLDGQQPVERPEVQVLPPVKREPFLMRRQSGEHAEVDVGVMAGDVDIGVMEDDVLPAPEVGAPPDHLQSPRHERVDPGGVRVGLMAAVVLNVEPDPGREQSEQDGQQQALPPGLGHEHQQEIRAREAGGEDRRLHVHLPTVALPPAGGSEIFVDPPPELELEGSIVTELEASSRGCGSNGLARRARAVAS